ncbi:MAG: hypothetical protein K9L71_02850 [Candidatus Omnitrophica bacterium]|nr:hypothetical protein [Candidatus Omnitrophota bacterium]
MAVKERINKLNEQFRRFGSKGIDSKNRINLGKIVKLVSKIVKVKADGFDVYYGENGDILLRPKVSIPAREAWVYKNPKVIGKIRKGVADTKEGRTKKVDDLDKFFKEL